MARLPDFEGLAIFAKVAEYRSFAGAAAELRLSKATVSKAVSRIESRLGARLIIRTARSFELTDAGRQLAVRAAHILRCRGVSVVLDSPNGDYGTCSQGLLQRFTRP